MDFLKIGVSRMQWLWNPWFILGATTLAGAVWMILRMWVPTGLEDDST
jgi:hypothetical protein